MQSAPLSIHLRENSIKGKPEFVFLITLFSKSPSHPSIGLRVFLYLYIYEMVTVLISDHLSVSKYFLRHSASPQGNNYDFLWIYVLAKFSWNVGSLYNKNQYWSLILDVMLLNNANNLLSFFIITFSHHLSYPIILSQSSSL